MNNLRYLPLVVFLLFSAAARAGDCTRYTDSVFQYSICTPHDWKKTYKDIGYKHFIILNRSRASGVEISVTASRFDEDEKSKWDNWKKWYIRGIGSGFLKIIETKEIPAENNVTVKIFVFDYYARGVRMLQRTMLSKYGDKFLVVECRAPLRSFSRYTDLFNMVMSSVDYSGTLTGENMDAARDDEPVTRKQAGPKKYADNVKRKEKKQDSSPIITRKEKPDTGLNNKLEVKPEAETGKGEEVELDLQSIEDPEAKKIIETELNRLQELEQKGVIEKIHE